MKPKKWFRNIFQQPSRVESVWEEKRKRGGEGGGSNCEERFRIWIVEIQKYEIFHWIHPLKTLLPLLMLWLPPKRKASKIWASRSFAPHKHAHTMERNFHLFYSLTKLTSTYFCFFSNIIKAVKRAKVSEEQFVTVLPSCVYLRPIMYVVQFRKYGKRLRKHVC